MHNLSSQRVHKEIPYTMTSSIKQISFVFEKEILLTKYKDHFSLKKKKKQKNLGVQNVTRNNLNENNTQIYNCLGKKYIRLYYKNEATWKFDLRQGACDQIIWIFCMLFL